jgi:DNA-binding XRE family transcriptional regulator
MKSNPRRGAYMRVARRLGSRLASLRCASDLTQDEVAARVNRSRRTYSAWELTDLIPERHMAGVAAALGLSVEALRARLYGCLDDFQKHGGGK